VLRTLLQVSPSNVFIGDPFPDSLDSRLKHAGMTDFGKKIGLTQQAAGNRPTEIEAGKIREGLKS